MSLISLFTIASVANAAAVLYVSVPQVPVAPIAANAEGTMPVAPIAANSYVPSAPQSNYIPPPVQQVTPAVAKQVAPIVNQNYYVASPIQQATPAVVQRVTPIWNQNNYAPPHVQQAAPVTVRVEQLAPVAVKNDYTPPQVQQVQPERCCGAQSAYVPPNPQMNKYTAVQPLAQPEVIVQQVQPVIKPTNPQINKYNPVQPQVMVKQVQPDALPAAHVQPVQQVVQKTVIYQPIAPAPPVAFQAIVAPPKQPIVLVSKVVPAVQPVYQAPQPVYQAPLPPVASCKSSPTTVVSNPFKPVKQLPSVNVLAVPAKQHQPINTPYIAPTPRMIQPTLALLKGNPTPVATPNNVVASTPTPAPANLNAVTSSLSKVAATSAVTSPAIPLFGLVATQGGLMAASSNVTGATNIQASSTGKFTCGLFIITLIISMFI
ncbi:hypothetical protein BC830DRAFT_1125239 [Chytriomyces sp. MP71]|nr:hypothetical protein BC830DRAFT_1125239 [Chytriomyces sp. MP71]